MIALHGLGGNEDSFFDNYSQLPPQLAEKHGFLLAAPLGFRVDGFYGSIIMGAGDAASRRRGEYSEKDVLEVLRLMKAAYKVDESRIYLIGHSMGAIGTWALGAKYPETWAALVPFSGVGSPALAETHEGHPAVRRPRRRRPHRQRLGIAQHGGGAEEAGANVTYIEVAGGSHTDVVVPEPAAGVRVPRGATRKARDRHEAMTRSRRNDLQAATAIEIVQRSRKRLTRAPASRC